MKKYFGLEKSVFVQKLLAVIIGDLITAIAVVIFLKPNMMISGGITGVSILIETLTNINLGLLVFVLNLPLLIIGFFFLNFNFIFFSGISIVVLSGWIWIIEMFIPQSYAPTYDVLLACIYGGILNGIGGGLNFKYGTSTGGLDIVAAILKKYANIKIGKVLMSINIFVIGASAFIFGVNRALYTLVALYISYNVMDDIQLGVGRQKEVYIMSSKFKEITEKIQTKLGRGITLIDGEGAYERKRIKIIYLICTSRELVKVKNIVTNTDDSAFMSISETSEIKGKGFKSIEI